MDRRTAVRKLKACLRLAKSSNAHEAAAAMRQAQKLMELYELTVADAEDVGFQTHETRYRGKKGPPRRLRSLAVMVGRAFRCLPLTVTRHGDRSQFVFVGPGAMPELAVYAYVQLERQLNHAAREFRAVFARLPKNWTRLREDFADGWTIQACQQITAPELNSDVQAMLIAHYEANKGIEVSKGAGRRGGRQRAARTNAYEYGAYVGQQAVVHQGMDGDTVAGIAME